MGKLAQGWATAYESTKLKGSRQTRDTDPLVWGSRLTEVFLQHTAMLWEQRNKELHGETNCSVVQKERLASEVRELQSLREKARPQDAFMFINDVDTYLSSALVYTMTLYLSMTKKAILNSVKKRKKMQEAGMVTFINWLRVKKENNAFIDLAEKRARNIWMDGRKKERRCLNKDTRTQQSIVGYLSLFGTL